MSRSNDGLTLIFRNGDEFDPASRFVKTLVLADFGAYAGYYQGGINLTVLAHGLDPDAPALGAAIVAEMRLVDGPAGGVFAFWEAGATAPTLEMSPMDEVTHRVVLGENDGAPGTDPGGHIHGRRWTASTAGIYTLELRAVDVSTHGVNDGPIHQPSLPLRIQFQAGIHIRELRILEGRNTIEFGAEIFRELQLEKSSHPGAGLDPIWMAVGDPVSGDDRFHVVEDLDPNEGPVFYRVKEVTP